MDCSGAASARALAVRSTARWGRCAFVGEGGEVTLDVSQWLIHRQVSLHGSWVTSVPHMRELLERLDVWQLHPEQVVSHRFALAGRRRGVRRGRSWQHGQGMHRLGLNHARGRR